MRKEITPSIQILVAYHRRKFTIKKNYYLPIHVGRACSSLSHGELAISETEMQGDDTEENISDKNDSYAELTGIYWAWKNYERLGNPKFIGFAHYRRFMSFNPMEQEEPMIVLQNFTEAEVEYYMPQQFLLEAVRQFDLLVPKRVPNFSEGKPKQALNLIEHWEEVHGTKHLEQALKCARQLFPECGAVIDEYMNSTSGGYWWNMLIARKDIFFDYCHFIFSILDQMEKQGLFTGCTGYNRRMPAFVAERLSGVYITMKKMEPSLKIAEYSTICLADTVRHERPSPALIAHYKRKHFWYALFSHLTFGKMRASYRQKRRHAKEMFKQMAKVCN